ncbi:hypothetical protein [Bacillus atrophaeus]|uniref:hypothetical protein n=1 Tax=Bacillus atrophaeus TaxID=1452 RepID=UPI00227DBA1F|nr:hypothetical protein [Bacillus atrophaeus]MCY8465542.1 hypothetical protein [Bacillus atrophaeus]MCY8478704.1 hypothetical protein [Bacillus atrophaeus]MCY8958319.1 hypothetical protein [Bacillus atrophaeus]MCY8963892.1 hypothetical protein [Bacillus atrophaeus]MCY8971497.1 hypothetical protein [Bacillus atrophaeus]
MDNDKEIAAAYTALWNNRSLAGTGIDAVRQAIDLELLDKMTHPRLRKPLLEKYFSAMQRIVNSQLKPVDKYRLVELHTERLQHLREERGEQL